MARFGTRQENGWRANRSRVMKVEFSLGGDKLILQPGEGSPMMGTVSDVVDGRFTFRIVGAPPGDKGLQFAAG